MNNTSCQEDRPKLSVTVILTGCSPACSSSGITDIRPTAPRAEGSIVAMGNKVLLVLNVSISSGSASVAFTSLVKSSPTYNNVSVIGESHGAVGSGLTSSMNGSQAAPPQRSVTVTFTI